MPFAAGLGDAQDWIFLERLKGGYLWRGSRVDISAPDPVSPLGGVADSSPQQQGLGAADRHSKGLMDDPDFRSSLQISKEWGAGLQTIC